MTAVLFRGKPEALVVEVNNIIGGGNTITQVLRMTAGHYLIIYTTP